MRRVSDSLQSAQGAGKYDAICEKVFHDTNADGVLLIIIDGIKGSGFSAVLTNDINQKVPAILRRTADMIEAARNKATQS